MSTDYIPQQDDQLTTPDVYGEGVKTSTKKIYMYAAIVLSAAIVVVVAWFLTRTESTPELVEEVSEERQESEYQIPSEQERIKQLDSLSTSTVETSVEDRREALDRTPEQSEAEIASSTVSSTAAEKPSVQNRIDQFDSMSNTEVEELE